MAKFHKVKEGIYVFHCPGCGHAHLVHTKESGAEHPRCWTFNGDLNNPTVLPSIRQYNPPCVYNNYLEQTVCHSFVENGKIRFLSDCMHSMAGQTVEIGDFETLPPNWKD